MLDDTGHLFAFLEVTAAHNLMLPTSTLNLKEK
jgi:hypothetical protein